jgi:hypothetical protein
LGELLSQQTRLVSLASPQNPSGVAIRAHTLREILALMARKCPQAYLLIDETYRDAAYGDDEIASSAVNLGPRVISTASLSKCHGAAGLRLGWAITPDTQLREQLVRGKFNTIISCSQVDEALAIRVLQQRERILDNRRRHLVEGLRRTELWAQQNSTHVDWVRPDAGALCCVRLKESGFDTARVERFYSALEDAGVRVANGEWFGEESRVFRLGFGLLPMHELEAALELLSRVLGQTASGQDESRRVS